MTPARKPATPSDYGAGVTARQQASAAMHSLREALSIMRHVRLATFCGAAILRPGVSEQAAERHLLDFIHYRRDFHSTLRQSNGSRLFWRGYKGETT
jgi:hypothetical protein